MLWHNNEVYVIDVSQSVESDHPSALDFLRKDCQNVNDFFRRAAGLQTMSTKELFEFVTRVGDGDETAALDNMMDTVEKRSLQLENETETGRLKLEREASSAEAVFMSQFIPRSLNQIDEKEQRLMREGEREADFVNAVDELTGGGSGNDNANDVDCVDEDVYGDENNDGDGDSDVNSDVNSDSDDDDDDNSDSGSGDSDEEKFIKVAMTEEELKQRKEERKMWLKENKKKAKEEAALKRTTKVKKKDKKRAINKAKNKRKGGG